MVIELGDMKQSSLEDSLQSMTNNLPQSQPSYSEPREYRQFLDNLGLNTESLELGLLTLPESFYPALWLQIVMEFLSRYSLTGSMEDIDRATKMAEKAVEWTSQDHPYRAENLKALATALRKRFERMGSIDDLDRAIRT